MGAFLAIGRHADGRRSGNNAASAAVVEWRTAVMVGGCSTRQANRGKTLPLKGRCGGEAAHKRGSGRRQGSRSGANTPLAAATDDQCT